MEKSENNKKTSVNLTYRQQKFCDYYIQCANATEAYKRAGYRGQGNTAEAAAARMLSNVKVADYIRQRNEEIANERIADMQEVKEYWTDVLRDKEEKTRDRLKASEYIAKTNAAFIDRQEHSGDINLHIGIDYGDGDNDGS